MENGWCFSKCKEKAENLEGEVGRRQGGVHGGTGMYEQSRGIHLEAKCTHRKRQAYVLHTSTQSKWRGNRQDTNGAPSLQPQETSKLREGREVHTKIRPPSSKDWFWDSQRHPHPMMLKSFL
jgi:hypothetical protein